MSEGERSKAVHMTRLRTAARRQTTGTKRRESCALGSANGVDQQQGSTADPSSTGVPGRGGYINCAPMDVSEDCHPEHNTPADSPADSASVDEGRGSVRQECRAAPHKQARITPVSVPLGGSAPACVGAANLVEVSVTEWLAMWLDSMLLCSLGYRKLSQPSRERCAYCTGSCLQQW